MACLSVPLGGKSVNRAAAIVVAREQPFFLEVSDVLVDGGQRVQIQSVSEFLE